MNVILVYFVLTSHCGPESKLMKMAYLGSLIPRICFNALYLTILV